MSITKLSFFSHNNIKNSIPSNVEKLEIYFIDSYKDNQVIDNILIHIKQIKINNKIFGCKITKKYFK